MNSMFVPPELLHRVNDLTTRMTKLQKNSNKDPSFFETFNSFMNSMFVPPDVQSLAHQLDVVMKKYTILTKGCEALQQELRMITREMVSLKPENAK